jgi:hypothetical protein
VVHWQTQADYEMILSYNGKCQKCIHWPCKVTVTFPALHCQEHSSHAKALAPLPEAKVVSVCDYVCLWLCLSVFEFLISANMKVGTVLGIRPRLISYIFICIFRVFLNMVIVGVCQNPEDCNVRVVDAGAQHRAISGQFSTPLYHCNGGPGYLSWCGHGLESEELGFDSWEGQKIFLFSSRCPDQLWDPHSLLHNGSLGSCSEVKGSGSEVNS